MKLQSVARRSAVALAVWVLLGGGANAAIVTTGLVSPDPSSGSVTGSLSVGTTGVGSVTVNGGSSLAAQRLNAGTGLTGDGRLIVTGAGSSISTDFGVVGTRYNTNIGSQGIGSLSVLAGGSFANGINDTNCQLNCNLYFSNGAGSDGTLLVSGAGSNLGTVGGVRVGYASVFTLAVGGLDYGIAGGASQGRATVSAGASVQSSLVEIGRIDLASEINGRETASGNVLVDGVGSAWNLVRNAAQTGARTLIAMATQPRTTATLEVKNGAVVRLNGSSAPAELAGINMGTAAGATATDSVSSVTVNGPGSRLESSGAIGFFNIGRGVGAVAQVNITGGGVITSTSESGLGFMTVGRGGATGTLNVNGAGSLLRLTGKDAAGAGAGLQVGRFDVVAGTGSANVLNGARIEIDTSALALTPGLGQPGLFVGNTNGSNGTFTINGAGSVVQILGGTGTTPRMIIGNDGGTGQLSIANGGKLEISSLHLSVPSTTAFYLPGDAVFVDVGRRASGSDGNPTTGTLTVTGTGSEFTMSGTADRLLQVGNGSGANGTLNILSGGKVQSTALLVGTGDGGTGTLNMNAGLLVLDGQRLGGPAAPGGAGIAVGRGGGTGTAIIGGRSTVVINTSAPDGGIAVGGSTVQPSGTGTMLINGGSTVTVNGPQAAVTVGSEGTASSPALGTMVLAGTGTSLAITGSNARVLVGNSLNSVGTLSIGAGTTLSSSGLIGVAHSGTASTGGSGVMIVNGVATAPSIINGSSGYIGGTGTLVGAVTNHGTIGPGLSPGRLTINGPFDSSDGKIVLEVQALAGGGYAVDELVFGDALNVLLGNARIEFSFLGDTNPNAFDLSGLFEVASFFKEVDAGGSVVGIGSGRFNWFDNALFSARSDRYTFSSFSFTAAGGAVLVAAPIPVPATLPLVLLALLTLGARRGPARAGGVALNPPRRGALPCAAGLT